MPTKSGRITPKKEKKQVSTAQQWKAGKTYELEVPSGNVCLVRKPDGLKAFMVDGRIPNSLMPLVEEALDTKTSNELDMKAILNDPNKMADLMSMVDQIAINVVVEPKIHRVPMVTDPDPMTGATTPREGPRDPDALYVDEVDMEDKLHVMGWAFAGVNDMGQFRQATAANVASLADGEGPTDNPIVTVEPY